MPLASFGSEWIDRRKCHRVVPLKVLALGFPRTGTESLRIALKTLGFNETYHGWAAYSETPLDCDMWLEACSAKFLGKGTPYTRKDWDQLLGHCQAVSDAPPICFSQELIAAYPDAKVILTNRDMESWYASYCQAIVAPMRTPSAKILKWTYRLTRSPLRRLFDVREMILKHFAHVDLFAPVVDTTPVRQVFVEHYENVRQLVPKDRLLEFRVQDGWEPLCKFLEVDIPDQPFPRSNDLQSYNKNLDISRTRQMRLVGIKLLIGLGMGGIVWQTVSNWKVVSNWIRSW